MTHAVSAELLEKTHDFPGPYLWKVFALTRETLESETRDAVIAVLAHEDLTTRISTASEGRNMCVSVEAHVEGAQQVIEVYAALQRIPGLRMLL